MHPAFLVRFFPSGPWRIGPDSGARDGVESVLHSDALYSAVTAAMARLGLLEEWLAAVFNTADGPSVRFSSCYPFQQELLFVLPPLSLWPPAPSLKVRWKGARFHVRFVVDILCEEDKVLPALLVEGLRLLEDDSLGGGGSRGSGRVRFAKLRLTWRGRGFYASGAPETEHLTGAGLAEVQSLMSDSEFPAKLAE